MGRYRRTCHRCGKRRLCRSIIWDKFRYIQWACNECY